jgi:predicted nucleotidyltransferase
MVLARMTAVCLSQAETDQIIQKAVDWLRIKIQPKSIWLFGSASRYQLTQYSDLDIAVIFESDEELKKARSGGIFQLSQAIQWPVDLILITQTRFIERANIGGVCEIIKDEGICLYDTEA